MPAKLNRLLVFAVCLALVLSMPAEALNVDRQSSLTLRYSPYGINTEGAEFSLYQVALLDEDGKYTLTDDFDDYGLDVSGLTSGTAHMLANTLEAYVLRDKPQPAAKGAMGGDNSLLFSELQVGLYLAIGSPYHKGNYIYYAYPVAVSLPTNGEYDLDASPKYKRSPIVLSEKPSTTKLTALKLWQDEGHEAQRPVGINVQLLKDGEVCDTVTLSGENNWRYEWKGLNPKYRWDAVEETVPEGYTALISREGDTVAITNSYVPPVPGGSTGSHEPDEELEYDEFTRPVSGSSNLYHDKLPQTGMLWWPVPLMAGAGVVLFSAGWMLDRKRDEDDEE